MEKQLMALTRGRSTNIITRSVLSQTGASETVLKAYDILLQEYDYLEHLYCQRRMRSLLSYLTLVATFVERGALLKESIRLLAVSIFGTKTFLKYKR